MSRAVLGWIVLLSMLIAGSLECIALTSGGYIGVRGDRAYLVRLRTADGDRLTGRVERLRVDADGRLQRRSAELTRPFDGNAEGFLLRPADFSDLPLILSLQTSGDGLVAIGEGLETSAAWP
jgi:hypothetical protein